VFGTNPVILDINVLDALVSTVLLVNNIVGDVLVLHTIPLAVIFPPPLDIIFTPLVAPFEVTLLTTIVPTVGATTLVADVVKVSSGP
jgi:hypothetical protein